MMMFNGSVHDSLDQGSTPCEPLQELQVSTPVRLLCFSRTLTQYSIRACKAGVSGESRGRLPQWPDS